MNIIGSTVQKNHKSGGENVMMEKIYNTMKSVGVWNLVLGIVLILSSLTAGIFLIINGVKLLKKKSDLLF